MQQIILIVCLVIIVVVSFYSQSTAAAVPTSTSLVLLRGASPCSALSSILPTAARTLTLAMADATDKAGGHLLSFLFYH